MSLGTRAKISPKVTIERERFCDPKQCSNRQHSSMRRLCWVHFFANLATIFVTFAASSLYIDPDPQWEIYMNRLSFLGKVFSAVILLSYGVNGLGCLASLSCAMNYLSWFLVGVWVCTVLVVSMHSLQLWCVVELFHKSACPTLLFVMHLTFWFIVCCVWAVLPPWASVITIRGFRKRYKANKAKLHNSVMMGENEGLILSTSASRFMGGGPSQSHIGHSLMTPARNPILIGCPRSEGGSPAFVQNLETGFLNELNAS